MQLMHYTQEPLVFDRDRTYGQPPPEITFSKPNGLWVSVTGEDDWPTWCRDNDFRYDTLTFSYLVQLAPRASVLHITAPSGIDRFEATYAHETRIGRGYGSIDWCAVADDYDGIIIAPYQWSRRFSHMWYYGWDCASGCIWSTDAVLGIEQVAVSNEAH